MNHVCATCGVEHEVLDFSDLMDRPSIIGERKSSFHDATVLITGAGGSIGLELSKYIASCSPRKMVFLSRGEVSLMNVENTIEGLYSDIPYTSVLCDVRDEGAVFGAMEKHSPDIVFHLASHRSIKFVEKNVGEAHRANFLGTRYMLNASDEFGVAKFVYVSTDKAAAPTSVYGKSKRRAERIIQSRRNGDYDMTACAVRFGNVIGARASVVPFFRAQIARGGPVIVRSKDASRLFMTFDEAVYLVTEATVLGSQGDILIPKITKHVSIYDLAVFMVEKSGKNVEIKVTEMLEGEKEREVFSAPYESVTETENPMIFSIAPLGDKQ